MEKKNDMYFLHTNAKTTTSSIVSCKVVLNSGISYLSSRSIFLTCMCLYSAVSRISLELMEVRASKTLKFVIFFMGLIFLLALCKTKILGFRNKE